MIPTLILIGLVFGRWWRILIPLAAIGWPVLLIATGVDAGFDFVPAAAALAVANTLVGVLVFQALRFGVRTIAAAARTP